MRITGVQGMRITGVQGMRITGVQGMRITGVQGMRITGVHGVRLTGVQGGASLAAITTMDEPEGLRVRYPEDEAYFAQVDHVTCLQQRV
ncbi:hypothetical protein C0Q70_21384 [Pomacea canaliculata]|uniref:Uncharacterized protein n=1 Tax=Pomacea canaliculata TaxID=400727 RepID=A0A2T7NCD5_POMCA|nr:hypothetical protein C0Q70_21384 [Pomacea canaliculata]